MFTDDQGASHETPDELSIEKKLDLILVEIKHMRAGFPKDEDGNADYDGHRKYHEQLMRAAEAQTEFWNDLKKEIAKKGILTLVVILCGLVVLGIQAKFGLVPLK